MASALLLVALVPILKGLTTASLDTSTIEYRTKSLVLAQAKLDKIKAHSIYHFTDSFAEEDVSLDGSYLCNVADDSGDPLKTITVSVGCDTDGDSSLDTGEVQVTLATLLARRWPD